MRTLPRSYRIPTTIYEQIKELQGDLSEEVGIPVSESHAVMRVLSAGLRAIGIASKRVSQCMTSCDTPLEASTSGRMTVSYTVSQGDTMHDDVVPEPYKETRAQVPASSVNRSDQSNHQSTIDRPGDDFGVDGKDPRLAKVKDWIRDVYNPLAQKYDLNPQSTTYLPEWLLEKVEAAIEENGDKDAWDRSLAALFDPAKATDWARENFTSLNDFVTWTQKHSMHRIWAIGKAKYKPYTKPQRASRTYGSHQDQAPPPPAVLAAPTTDYEKVPVGEVIVEGWTLSNSPISRLTPSREELDILAPLGLFDPPEVLAPMIAQVRWPHIQRQVEACASNQGRMDIIAFKQELKDLVDAIKAKERQQGSSRQEEYYQVAA